MSKYDSWLLSGPGGPEDPSDEAWEEFLESGECPETDDDTVLAAAFQEWQESRACEPDCEY